MTSVHAAVCKSPRFSTPYSIRFLGRNGKRREKEKEERLLLICSQEEVIIMRFIRSYFNHFEINQSCFIAYPALIFFRSILML